jgi:cysteine desulfurase
MSAAVYLDHNATTPVHPEILAKVPEWLASWGNPSSIHAFGRGPKSVLREARQKIADLAGVQPLELIFTAGGSEANNLALKGAAVKRKHFVVSAVEHPSVRKTAEWLQSQGAKVDFFGVDREGRADLDQLRALVTAETAMVSCMLANNETGHIYPLKEIAAIAHAQGALVHTDAVQALGKIEINLRELGVDLATFSGHKFYALKGCGVLYARKGVTVNPVIHGGAQERGRRAGTENLLSIAALGFMCGKKSEIAAQGQRIAQLRDHMEKRILSEIGHTVVTGPSAPRLPNTSSLCLQGVDGETLLMNLDVRGFGVSTGAACSSGNPEPSPTLLAMGLTREEAQSSLRLSLGWGNTREEVDRFVDELKLVVARLRSFEHGQKVGYGV